MKDKPRVCWPVFYDISKFAHTKGNVGTSVTSKVIQAPATAASTSTFQFVNIAKPSELIDPKTKTFVRKHVWRHRKRGSRPVVIRPLLSKEAQSSASTTQTTARGQTANRRVLPAGPRTLARNDLVDAMV